MATGDEATCEAGKETQEYPHRVWNKCKKPKPAKKPNRTKNPRTRTDNNREGAFPFPEGCGGALPEHRTHLWRRGRGGGGCAAPGARAPPPPRLCPRYATGNGARPGRKAGAVATLARSRLISSCLPAEKAEQLSRAPAARSQGETEPAAPPGAAPSAACGPVGEELPPQRAAGAPSGLRQGDSGDARLRLGEAQRTAAGCRRTAPRGPAPPGPALSPAAAPALPAARAASGTALGAPTSACAAPALRTRPGSGPAHPRAAPPRPALPSARGRGAAGARPGLPPVPQAEPVPEVPSGAAEGWRRPAEVFSACQSRYETSAGTKGPLKPFTYCEK